MFTIADILYETVLHFWACVCSLSYPARKAHAPYYMLIGGLSVSAIFFHIISQTTRI